MVFCVAMGHCIATVLMSASLVTALSRSKDKQYIIISTFS